MSEELALDDDSSALDSTRMLADDSFILALRQQMVKFATLQLSDRHLAEDTVQEALAGALKNAKSFAGKSALKSWVFAILKHKIADGLRSRQRQANITNRWQEEGKDQDLDSLFDHNGHWQAGVQSTDWGNPELAFKQQQFWQVFELCLDKLPPQQARIFMMREFIGLETNEICAAANLSTSNLFVILHRARLRLGQCLEHNWFLKGGEKC